MALEIERKYLLKRIPVNLLKEPPINIKQGYLLTSEKGFEIRLRQQDNTFFQTFKSEGTLIREEIEIELSKIQFDYLWKHVKSRIIQKQRYVMKYNDLFIELDVYKGELEGLVVAEVEFDNVQDSKEFIPPDYFNREITFDKQFKNYYLADKELNLTDFSKQWL